MRVIRKGAVRARSVTAVACAAVALSGVVAACGSSSSKSGGGSSTGSSSSPSSSSSTSVPSGSPFTYLVVLDETGPDKIFGPAQILAAQSAAKYLNASRGGILGHPVKLTVLNDNGDPTTAVSVVTQYLSSHPKPNLIYPGTVSGDIEATLPLVTRGSVFSIANEQGVPGALSKDASTEHPLQFTTVFPTEVPSDRAVQWFQKQGAKKVGIAVVDSAYDLGDAADLGGALKKAGIAFTQSEFPTTSVDPEPELQKLKSAGVDAVYCGCLGPAMGYVLKARADLGWDVPVLASLAASAQDITTLVAKSDLNDVYELTSREDTAKYASLPASKYLVAQGFAKKAGIAPMSVAGNAWDPLMLAADAAKRANSIDPNAMAKVLETTGGSGICDSEFLLTSCYKFSANSHVPSYPTNVFSVVPVGPVANGIVR